MSKRKTDFRTLRARRDYAIERNELRSASEPRQSAAGATSFPVKAEDPELRAMIDTALTRRTEWGPEQ